MTSLWKYLIKIRSRKGICQSYYLVDFENVRSKEILSLENINKGDVLIVFYSDNSGEQVSFDLLEHIAVNKAHIKTFKTYVGTSNALDFQLSSYLGYLIKENPYSKFYIVSNDKGYDCLCVFWKNLGYDVERVSVESSITNTKTNIKKKKKKSAKNQVKVSMQEITRYLNSNEDIEDILMMFNSSNSKQEFNIKLSKKYRDSKKSSEIYKKLKPLVTKKFTG
jgi:hypothetical protein